MWSLGAFGIHIDFNIHLRPILRKLDSLKLLVKEVWISEQMVFHEIVRQQD